MFLGFDIGNTNTVMGLYEGDSVTPQKTFRFETVKFVDASDLGREIMSFLETDMKVSGMAFSSVVPEVNDSYHDMCRSLFNLPCLEISHRSRLSIKILYKDHSELGVDRIVNSEAVYREYGGNSIIIDIGTAATFCVLLEDGTFDGGLIAPGIGTTIKALSSSASNLPAITFEKPDRLVARDTENAIKSGFFYGWLSLVEGVISRIEEQYDKSFNVIMTGGFSGIISENISIKNTVDPHLVMKGIRYIYDLNK